ncbi:formate/nitrite transporter family protein [Agriterribacter sp.]|uniref:formate/nitrite transporter family protein n=1 Tax=Agriterribacter sp. TaxID=2821509 RepID=UPI002BB65895|nr:formate/nitrite transporter family protein [Agriterribacter sp.]HRO45857.1 formate/nitrite transporter family protein [Agriterribacter sp.]HRQ16201.1 formate/nitrite transporter family protein [Agriterribacter sp.]
MSYTKPAEVINLMIQAGKAKIQLSPSDLLIRSALSGAILGFGTTLAVTATVQTGSGILGAAIFPACFIIVVLLGLELVTGSFAILPAAYFDRKITMSAMIKNLLFVFAGNLLGALLYAVLFWISLTNMGSSDTHALIPAIIKIAEAKTTGYAQYGAAGMITVFTKGILCNWMVTLGVVLFLTSTSASGKIIAAWLPIFIFFAQGFEHAVVNMFVIPAGMMLGAKVNFGDWWIYNQLPVTLGNIVGGVIFTALALYLTYKEKVIPAKEIEMTGSKAVLMEKAGYERLEI